MPAGRPSEYSEEMAIDICSRLASGEPLVRICRDEHMPDVRTVYRWLVAHEAFSQMYARAREDQADTLADEIIEISDESKRDKIIDADGNERMDSEYVARSRLRVDARKWVAAKLKPRKYGDKISTEHSGPDGGPIQVSKIERVLIKPDLPKK